MKYDVKVFLEDELPLFGSGWRTLHVNEGNSDTYARLTDCAGRTKRVKIELIDHLVERTDESARVAAMKEAA